MKVFEEKDGNVLVPKKMLEVLVARSMIMHGLEQSEVILTNQVFNALAPWEYFPTAVAIGAGKQDFLKDETLHNYMRHIDKHHEAFDELYSVLLSIKLMHDKGVTH